LNKEFVVVSEGTTDFAVLKPLISHCGNQQGRNFKVRPLWPGDKHSQRAGWTSMKNWCLEQASALAGNQNRLLAASLLNPNLKAAVVRKQVSTDKIAAAFALSPAGTKKQMVLQLDADIAHHLLNECAANTGFAPPLTVEQRKTLCANSMATWLGGHSVKIGVTIILCITTLSLETWILATHDQAELNAKVALPFVIGDYDHISQQEEVLLQLGYSGDGSPSDRRLRKSPGLYAQYSGRLVATLNDARYRSTSLNQFCDDVIG
jgi:hypothetical protein